MCRGMDGVYIATPDDEIANAVEAFGGKVIMTSPLHQRASDRVAEAAQVLDVDIVVRDTGVELPMVTVVEELPAGYSYSPGSASHDGVVGSDTITWQIQLPLDDPPLSYSLQMPRVIVDTVFKGTVEVDGSVCDIAGAASLAGEDPGWIRD